MHPPGICWTSMPRPWIFSTIHPVMWMHKESKTRSGVTPWGRVFFQGTRHFPTISTSYFHSFMPFLCNIKSNSWNVSSSFCAILPFCDPLKIKSGSSILPFIVHLAARIALFVSDVDPTIWIVCDPLFIYVRFE